MKTLKNTLTAIALFTTVQFGFAQSMKSPVSHQLKNGMTIIVAENSGTQKVYANLNFEGADRYTPESAAVQELVNTILTQQLPAVYQGLSFTEKGINLATTADQFQEAITAMNAYVSAPEFTSAALNNAKASVLAHLTAQNKYYPKSITAGAITNINVSDLKAYYAQVISPASAYLTVAGNINASTVKAYAKKEFNRKKKSDDQSNVYLVSNF